MGELTKLNYANNAGCLRATIPSFIVKHYGLKVGDCIEWDMCVIDGELVVKVIPRKA